MNKAPIILVAVGSALLITVNVVLWRDNLAFGKTFAEYAAMLDECARKANVYPTSCEMQAVVVKGRDLLPIPDAVTEGQ